MKQLKRVLIMAGGTGGHVFPGLAVANYLQSQQVEVHWLGTQKGLEAKVVPEAKIPLHLVNITGVRGKGKLTQLLAPYKIGVALWQSLKIMRQVKPDVVLGMGGFVSGPGGVASWLSGIPLVLHEQNAIAGTTNKILSYFAKKILAGFPSAFKSNAKVVTVGNPVRMEIESLPPPSVRFSQPHQPIRLLVLGGSLGAQGLNDVVPRAMALLQPGERPKIIHQTGENFLSSTKSNYETRGIEVDLKPFVKNMAEVYSWADIILCRAGALTVAEVCAVGLGAIFVPFPFAIDDHQSANAAYLVNHQAALCIQQNDLTDTRLADIVREFSKAPDKRLAMAEAAYQLRHIKVAEKIYTICKEVCL